MKILLVLPVLFILVAAFAEPEYTYSTSSPEGVGDQGPGEPQKSSQTIKGVVVDSKTNAPLAGASVIVSGTSAGAVTGKDGSCVVSAINSEVIKDVTKLVISYVGYRTQKVNLPYSDVSAGNANFRVALERDTIFALAERPSLAPPPPPVTKAKAQTANKKVNMGVAPPPPPVPAGASKKDAASFIMVEQLPEYPGGYNAFLSKVQAGTVLAAKEKNLAGQYAKMVFTIDEAGRVTDVKKRVAVSEEAAVEAAKILQGLPAWSPGKQQGKAVSVTFMVKVEF